MQEDCRVFIVLPSTYIMALIQGKLVNTPVNMMTYAKLLTDITSHCEEEFKPNIIAITQQDFPWKLGVPEFNYFD